MKALTSPAILPVVLILAAALPRPAAAGSPAWGVVDSPNQGTRDNALYGLSVLDATDVWAVGEWNPNVPPTETGRRTLIEHWDGAEWSIVPSPDPTWPGLDLARLESIAALAPDDVWAVGYGEDFASLMSTTLIEHWDGSEWSLVTSPNPAGPGLPNRLYDVAAVAADDIWAVGETGYPQRALILHYDGVRWSTEPNRCPGTLRAVAAAADATVWAVSDAGACRFIGHRWRRVKTPQPGAGELAFSWRDVSVVDADNAWAVGYRVIPFGESVKFLAVVMHWNGVQWTVDKNIPGQQMNGVLALAADDVWAVGSDGANSLILHWNGAGWSEVPTPGFTTGSLLHAVEGSDPTNLWAAGLYFEGGAQNDEQTLVMNAPSTTSGAVVGDTNVAFATISWIGPVNGSTQTNSFGEYQAAGLPAGEYTFIASESGCSPDVAEVTVVAGETVTEDFVLDC